MTAVATWHQFTVEAPELATEVELRLNAHKHTTMATIRRDGAPRICGTEVEIRPDGLYLGGMVANLRFADLRRDPRVAIHSGSEDPDRWTGDAKVSGTAVEVTDPDLLRAFAQSLEQGPPEPFELFVVQLTEATSVRLDPSREHLLIESWRPGRGVRTVHRT